MAAASVAETTDQFLVTSDIGGVTPRFIEILRSGVMTKYRPYTYITCCKQLILRSSCM
jgi:hypothetical protein